MTSIGALLQAPTVFSSISPTLSPRPSFSTKPATTASSSPMATSARIAIVGDVHDDWSLEEDTKAIQHLQPDLVLFTGDFGEENVELVQSVADLKFPKAVILGNHDAWYTHEFSQKKKGRVQLQLECLGEEHVGYRRQDFPSLKLSVVGGRPFTCGGQSLFRKKLLLARYGVQDMNDSAMKIYNTALGTPEDHLAIFLGHNGPTGLGVDISDICGKDWVFEGGDHGDPDLAQAIARLKETSNVNVPLVVFGHMHKELAYGKGLRKMIVLGSDNTIYLNGAIVPRVKRIADKQGTIRAFTVVDIHQRRVDKIVESWIFVDGDTASVEEEHVLYKCEG